jgi:putative transposase
MARLPRLALANHLHHVAQAGLNGGRIVGDDSDCHSWVGLLNGATRRHGVALHAWLLLPQRFHLLVTPPESSALSSMMQDLARDHGRQFNARHGRSGTVWAGRFRGSILEPEVYGLACMLMLDALPVRLGLAETAADYAWSSHRQYIGAQSPPGFPDLRSPPFIWQLGNTPFAREEAYRRLVSMQPLASRDAELQVALDGGWALGSREFLASLSKLTSRRLGKALPGRPRSAGR